MIDIHPKICNLCSGKVIYGSNADVYNGKEYGNGKCYRCLDCGAYVGTHKNRPKDALGLLSDERMRKSKMKCHGLFDEMWHDRNERKNLYKWLAQELGIPESECHFGHFDINMLQKAHKILCIEFKKTHPDFTHCYE